MVLVSPGGTDIPHSADFAGARSILAVLFLPYHSLTQFLYLAAGEIFLERVVLLDKGVKHVFASDRLCH